MKGKAFKKFIAAFVASLPDDATVNVLDDAEGWMPFASTDLQAVIAVKTRVRKKVTDGHHDSVRPEA